MTDVTCTSEWVILDTKYTGATTGSSVPDILKNLDENFSLRCRQTFTDGLEDSSKFLGDFFDANGKRDQEEDCKRIAQEEITDYSYLITKGRWQVCHFNVLPSWLQDNDFLLNGHRPPLQSFKECVKSMFRIHTETGNIWSHLIGAFMFALTGYGFLSSQPMNFSEQLAFAVFFFCVFICFFLSTIYHTMHCHSLDVSKLFCRLDYCGIVSIVGGCFTPWIHFLFWCSPTTKVFYMVLGYALCIITINLTMWEKFGRSQYRLLRASIFTGLAVSCSILPGSHFILVNGVKAAFVDLAFGWLFIMSAVAMSGVALYAMRIPERFVPGKFDIMCHSHQFFHVAVIVGAYVHLHCLVQMAEFRLNGDGGVCPADLNERGVF